ncbi:HD domain-containing protein [Alkalithermobacter paradoxus]|uniref:3'-5' exoribonuclease YhaM n=1 Tax=Alkalithermobacter paradoxus TaxID=29349 RepID=A0A1V4IAQ0_9FIRM|nr:3'-5' exoribonuclease YhaM [[Clostridium] thermoalcaliphilum]
MDKIFLKDIKENEVFSSSFMVMKIVYQDDQSITAFIGDKSGEIKSIIPKTDTLEVGDVIYIEGIKDTVLKVEKFNKIKEFKMEDYLPTVNRPIEDIMDEIRAISQSEFKSEECKTLDEYFFKDESFLKKFKSGIGGLRQHHNYIGGLAEHTLNVMYLAKTFAYRYDIRYKEIAILGAKLHDIGKIEEYSTNGPFSTTMIGDIQGHIVTGTLMLEEAFKSRKDFYSEEFKMRIKGCIIQHHGKVEYGSPKGANTEEAFVVHYADYVDANLNKIEQIRSITEVGTWSEYDRRIGTKLYM